MIKRLAATALPLLLIAQLATAGDDAGTYTVNGITLDGSSWTDATTTITSGQTYALAVNLGYNAAVSDASAYSSSQSMTLNLGNASGALLGTAAAATPYSTTQGGMMFTYIATASWLLEGSLTFDESIASPGTHTVSFSSSQFGSDAFRQNLTVQSAVAPAPSTPVPAPGTLASMALGLLGLTFLRRRMNRR